MTRGRATLAAAALAALLVLGCGGKAGNDPGRPKCVDDRGRHTACPDEW